MAFQNPTTPNIPDYVSFLLGVVGLDTRAFFTFSGDATNGSTTSQLFDVTDKPFNQNLAGYTCLDITQNLTGQIQSNDAEQVTFIAPLASPVNPGDLYVIAPDIVFTSFAVAMEMVNTRLACASARMYTLAVYNLSADRLINFALDLPNQSYFTDKRTLFRISDPTMGIVAMSQNQSTSMAYVNPEQMKLFTLAQLQQLKTPWGREYVSIAQSYGRVAFGLT